MPTSDAQNLDELTLQLEYKIKTQHLKNTTLQHYTNNNNNNKQNRTKQNEKRVVAGHKK
eukprot:gene16860-5189_t